MAHLVPSNIELANFHTSLESIAQLPNFHVPGVFVSSPESNFLVSWDCKLATAQGTFIAPFFFTSVTFMFSMFPNLIKQFPCCLISGILLNDIIGLLLCGFSGLGSSFCFFLGYNIIVYHSPSARLGVRCASL